MKSYYATTMTYLQDKKNRQSIVQKRVVVILVVLVLTVGMSRIKSLIAPTAYSVFSKSSSVSKGVTQNSPLGYLRSKQKLYKENISLKERLVVLEQEKNQLQITEAQNVEFRSILGAIPSETKKILVKPTLKSSVYNSIIIDAGTNKEIQASQVLVGVSGAMIGKVSEVYDTSSQVKLIDDSNVTTNLVSLDSNIDLEAKGESRGVLRAQLPRDSVIEIGEVVVLKDNPLLLVGTVADIRGDERNPFKEVLIRLKDQSRYSQYMYILQ